MKETIEEAAHRILTEYGIKSIGQSIGVIKVQELMVEMAKWQAERMYSEEEQLNLLNKYNEYLFTFIDKDVVGIGVEKEDVIKWFEQFKKKQDE